ncbi:MAG: hypothetical protein HGB15_11430, partial [Chlorobaculum sp.]|nr:hypothetical protein [Chlorobaculum sp.]
LPYLVQAAFAVSMFHLSGKSKLVVEQCDAKITDAIVCIEHFDHDAATYAGWGFIQGCSVGKKVHGFIVDNLDGGRDAHVQCNKHFGYL